MQTRVEQIPWLDHWAKELRSEPWKGHRAPSKMMIALGLDKTLQWRI